MVMNNWACYAIAVVADDRGMRRPVWFQLPGHQSFQPVLGPLYRSAPPLVPALVPALRRGRDVLWARRQVNAVKSVRVGVQP